MNKRSPKISISFSFIIFIGLFFEVHATNNSEPCGIFVLDNTKGGVSKSGLQLRDHNIRDYLFVRGYAWRTAWPNIETNKGAYDFSAIDHIIGKLEAIDQELSLLLLPGEPDYIAGNKKVLTWTHKQSKKSHGAFSKFRNGTRAVPWDPYLLSRFKAFMKALSEHQVYSSKLKQKVSLANHPTLKLVNTGIPGYGALRENRALRIANLPDYDRKKFTSAVLEALHDIRSFFPNQNYMIGLWKLNDGQRNPTLSEHIRKVILTEFDGVKYPKVGFFQENLAASKITGSKVAGFPRTRFAEPLYNSKNQTYIGFQALQGWSRPFRNPSKTANASPADGISFAYETYNTRYYELYAVDIDDKKNHKSLMQWSKTLCSDKN